MASKIMKAWEYAIEVLGFEKCPECHCSYGDDTQFKDFTCKTVVVCAQCNSEIGSIEDY